MSIVLCEVPDTVSERLRTHGDLTLFGLLRHENKLSVLHCTVQRVPTYTEPIASKDRLYVQVCNYLRNSSNCCGDIVSNS